MTFFVPPVTPIILGTLLDENSDGKVILVAYNFDVTEELSPK